MPDAGQDNEHGGPRNQCSASTLSLMKMAIHWKMRMNQGEGSVNIGEPSSKPMQKLRDAGSTKNCCDMFKKNPVDISWTIGRAEFDQLIASKKDSAPGLDGIPYGIYRCAGGLGAHFLFNTYKIPGGRRSRS